MTDNDDYVKLSDDRCAVKIYPEEEVADQWRTEAEDQDISLSRYLQNLINEARSYREHGLVQTDGSQKRVYLEEGIPVLVPTTYENEDGETVHADAEVMVKPGDTGFVRAFVDELPSPFDCETEVLTDLPVHDEE